MNNPFKNALKERAQIGLWLSMANAYSAEVCATANYDWLLIDGEHAPNNVQTTLAQLQAVAPYAAQPVVRAVTADVALVKQLLDIGAHNLLIPMIDTAEQARNMVRATRYPPDGIRGVGAAVARASRWGLEGQYLDQANDNICLLVQAKPKPPWATWKRFAPSKVWTACSSAPLTWPLRWATAATRHTPRCRPPSTTPSAPS